MTYLNGYLTLTLMSHDSGSALSIGIINKSTILNIILPSPTVNTDNKVNQADFYSLSSLGKSFADIFMI